MCRAPALLTMHFALMMSLNWRPPDVAVVSADTPTAWRLRWPVPLHFSMRILSANVPAYTTHRFVPPSPAILYSLIAYRRCLCMLRSVTVTA